MKNKIIYSTALTFYFRWNLFCFYVFNYRFFY